MILKKRKKPCCCLVFLIFKKMYIDFYVRSYCFSISTQFFKNMVPKIMWVKQSLWGPDLPVASL